MTKINLAELRRMAEEADEKWLAYPQTILRLLDALELAMWALEHSGCYCLGVNKGNCPPCEALAKLPEMVE